MATRHQSKSKQHAKKKVLCFKIPTWSGLFIQSHGSVKTMQAHGFGFPFLVMLCAVQDQFLGEFWAKQLLGRKQLQTDDFLPVVNQKAFKSKFQECGSLFRVSPGSSDTIPVLTKLLWVKFERCSMTKSLRDRDFFRAVDLLALDLGSESSCLSLPGCFLPSISHLCTDGKQTD